jgi:hypothetical protein
MEVAEKLAVEFEAITSPLDKALDRTKALIEKFGRDAERAAKTTTTMSGSATGAAVALRGLATVAATFGAYSFGKQALADAAALDKAARSASLTREAYQAFANGAKLAGVQDDLAGPLASFADRAQLARSRMGELYETLKFAAPAIAEQLSQTKTTAQALDVYAEAIRRVNGDEAKAVLAKKAFGEAGLSLLPILQRGSAGLMEMQAAGGQFVTVIQDRAVKAAKDLQTETALLGTEAKNQFANVMAPAVETFTAALSRTRQAMRNATSDSQSMTSLRLFGDVDDVDEVRRRVVQISSDIEQLKSNLADPGIFSRVFGNEGTKKSLAEAQDDLNRLNAHLLTMTLRSTAATESFKALSAAAKWDKGTTTAKADGFDLKSKPDYRGADAVASSVAALASARGEALRVAEIEGKQLVESARRLLEERAISERQFQTIRQNAEAATAAKIVEINRATQATLKGLDIEALTAREQHFDAIRAQYEADYASYEEMARKKLITEAELAKARENLNAVAGAKIKAEMERQAEEQRKQVEGISRAFEDAFGSTLTGKFQSASEAARHFTTTLVDGLHKAIMEALVLKPIMDAIKGTGQSTGIAGAIGGFLGFPQRAEGGPVMAGVPTLINERAGRKGEVFIPQSSGRMVPGERYQGANGGASSVVYNINAPGADAGTPQRIMQAIAAAEAQRKNSVEAQREFARRYPARAG